MSPEHKSLVEYAKQTYNDYERWINTEDWMNQEFTDFQDSLDKLFKAMGFVKEA